MRPNLITIIGTTGVGKSQLSVEIAKALNGEIINGDSMQMYTGLDNITNKHPLEEQENIPHHLLGHIGWKEEYSVTQFENEAIKVIEDIHSRGKLPILVGGTHYYNQSVLFKNSTIASSNSISRRPLTGKEEEILNSPVQVLEKLKLVDPLIAQKFHPNDTRRLRRALEIYFTTNKKPSDIYSEQKGTSDFENQLASRYRSLILWIWSEQSALDSRLDSRVDEMVRNGLYNEVDEMYREYTSSDNEIDLERGVWQVIGFRQFLPWMKGDEPTPNNCIASMKQVTRKYAKKQTKWITKKLLPMTKDIQSREDDLMHVCLLDATDISQWTKNVSDRGVCLSKEFLNHKPFSFLVPPGLEHLLNTRSDEDSFNSNKWKHFICDVCTDSENNQHISVGKEAWEIHSKSRRHKQSLKKLKRKQDFAEWAAKKKKDEVSESSSNVES